MPTHNNSPIRLLGGVPDQPTAPLPDMDGGDVNTYDAVTVAAVLDEHTEHLRHLEVRVQALESDIAALLLTVQTPSPRPWWHWWINGG